jgi:V/A-type H+-transporting ATPase subunit D
MIGPEQAPTRAAVLELKAERLVVTEAYDFLDEKRLLLAAELLRQLKRYERLLEEIQSLSATAGEALLAAVQLHGLQGLSIYPAAQLAEAGLRQTRRNFMGVVLVDTLLEVPASEDSRPRLAANPSVEAEQCRDLFRQLLQRSAVLAGVSGNLYRLLSEYRLTERRARALENVIIPEIEQALADMNTYLEELDLEEAVRARWHGTRRQPI